MPLRTLISAEDLARRAQRDEMLIVDCRFDLADPAGGAAAYARGHIPGAVHADLNHDLSDLSRPGLGRHPLPNVDAFARVLARWGWTPQRPVVAYDAANGALAAARLWWMLRLVSARDAAVLDGGLPAWLAAGQALDTRVPAAHDASPPALHYDTRMMIDSAALLPMVRTPALTLIDARAAARFRGESEPIDAVAGHIPGALNRPFAENLAADGRFKSSARLRDEFRDLLGARTPATVVHMCGSGVTACHNLLAMEHAGLAGSRVYAPSWSGWIADAQRPVATGD